jgi:hypothetical protein
MFSGGASWVSASIHPAIANSSFVDGASNMNLTPGHIMLDNTYLLRVSSVEVAAIQFCGNLLEQ